MEARRIRLLEGIYEPMSGTSMAAPIVSGAALLIWARNPTGFYRDIRSKLLSSYDYSIHLDSKLSTPGRINARKAVE
jgi:subtilisin family serine protease